MTTYKDLQQHEKNLFDKIEDLFLSSSMSRISFVRVLGVLINKHKKK